jgi:ribonucleoside-diphosphate reductase alpha chain
MDNDELPEVNPLFEKIAEERGFYSTELMREIAVHGTIHDIKSIPEDIRRVFVTAHDIEPEWHIKIQSAFQKYTDNAVSKTVNFSNSATKEDVSAVYMLAYKMGCKGVTIYRDGSRESQVLNIGSVNKEKKEETAQTPDTLTPRTRPEVTMGVTEKVKIGCGNLYITVNSDENGICEVFTNLGRAGGCPSQSEATSRLISIALRAGVDINEIIEQLRGIRCHSTLRQKDLKVLSCPDAIGRALERYMKLHVDLKDVKTIDELAVEIYKTCGSYLGAGLSILIDVLNPEIIVIGSIFARKRDLLWPAAKEVIEREALRYSREVCKVVPSGLGEEIGDLAALAVALKPLE